MVYVPGFTNMLTQPENVGGPARVILPLGVQPTAPAVMTATGVQPTAPPTMPQPAAPATYAPYVPATQPRLRGAAYTPRDLQNAGYLDERSMEPEEGFRRADPSFTRRISDSNTYYTDPDTGFFYSPDASRVGHYFTTNRGGAATAEGAGGFAEFNPNATYRLVNVADGNSVVYEGVGREGLIGVQGAAQRFAQEQGDQGDWRVEQMDPTSGQWSTVARDTRPSNIAGLIADIALPVAGAILLPMTGGLSGALAAGLGAAGGSALSSVAQGRSLGDTLLRAGLTGVTAGALSGATGALGSGVGSAGGSTGGLLATGGLLPTVGGGFSATLGSGVGSAIGSGLGSVASQAAMPEIIVSGALNAAGAGLGSTAGAALGSAAGSALGAAATGGGRAPSPQPAQPRPPVEITPEGNLILTGTPQAPGFNIVTGALPGLGAGLPAVIPAETIGNPIDVVRPRPVQEEFDAVFSPPPVVPPASPSVTETIGNPITVTADPNAPAAIDAATAEAIARGLLPMGGILPSGQTPTGGETTLETDRGILDRLGDRLGNLSLSEYLRLAGVALPLLDGIGGGGRRGGLGTIPAGMFGGSGVFGGSLPRPTLPGASTGFAPRAPSTLRPQTTQDWYRYGYGPEQSFFSDVPEGEENKSQAYTGYALGGMAGGGMRGMPRDGFAVHGPGTGRSDEIPAMLSDGEYVIDAETVALLGDGSSKAGADRLDQFRANVRKHKGRHLAKGDFSVDAKRPEHYLKGGRA